MKPGNVISAISIAALLAGCGGHDAEHKEHEPLPPVQVETAQVRKVTAPVLQEVPATVVAENRAVIAAKVTGTIETLDAKLGQKMEKGDLLVKIDAQEMAHRLQQAQASLAKVKRDLERETGLAEKGASTAETVKNLEDQVNIAEAMAQEAAAMLSYTKIHAPFAGVITRKPANEGDLATPGTPLLTIEDPDKLRIEADVPEALALNLEVGQTVPVEIPASAQRIEATIAEISPAADPGSRTFLVKADLPENFEARPGQFARLTLGQKEAEVILAPAAGITTWGQMDGVFVVEDGYLHLRLVKTGRDRGEGQVEVLTGLEGDETVAVGDLSSLRDRQPVQ